MTRRPTPGWRRVIDARTGDTIGHVRGCFLAPVFYAVRVDGTTIGERIDPTYPSVPRAFDDARDAAEAVRIDFDRRNRQCTCQRAPQAGDIDDPACDPRCDP